VVCEIGLALMLSISAGLLVEAFRKVLQVDPGFRPENVITFRVSVPDATYTKPEQKIAYYDNLLTRLRALPGVKAAGATSAPPLGGDHWGGLFEAEGRDVGRQGENPEVLRVAATPGYFDAIGMTLLEGRTFDEEDGKPNSLPVVMVNEALAKHFWDKESPVGKRIRQPGGKDWYEVIGLLRDEKHDGLDQEVKPGVFQPYSATILMVDRNDARALRDMSIILRSSAIDPTMLVSAAREVVHQLNPDIPMFGIQTMTEQLDRLYRRFALESSLPGHHLIQDCAEAKDVGALIRDQTPYLLRRHVADRAQHHPSLGHRSSLGCLRLVILTRLRL
jgi:hypothetical protein